MVTISCINVCAVKAQQNEFNLAQNRPTISAAFLNISIWEQTLFEHACAGRVTFLKAILAHLLFALPVSAGCF